MLPALLLSITIRV